MRSPSPTPSPPLARRNSRRERRTPNLKRGKYQREPKRRFILFCEGKNTEPAYFRAIERVCTSAQIEVQVEPAGGGALYHRRESRRACQVCWTRSTQPPSELVRRERPSVGGLRPRTSILASKRLLRYANTGALMSPTPIHALNSGCFSTCRTMIGMRSEARYKGSSGKYVPTM